MDGEYHRTHACIMQRHWQRYPERSHVLGLLPVRHGRTVMVSASKGIIALLLILLRIASVGQFANVTWMVTNASRYCVDFI
jgi:hypothetical protein